MGSENMKTILLFLIGLVCNAYAFVQYNELSISGSGLMNAALLCVLLWAGMMLFSSATEKDTVPRRILQGANFAFCMVIVYGLYHSAFGGLDPAVMIVRFLSNPSLSAFYPLTPGALILLLIVLLLSTFILDEVKSGLGQAEAATVVLWIALRFAQLTFAHNFLNLSILDSAPLATVIILISFWFVRWASAKLYPAGSLTGGIAQGVAGLFLLRIVIAMLPKTIQYAQVLLKSHLSTTMLIPFILLLILTLSALWMGIAGVRGAYRCLKGCAAQWHLPEIPAKQPRKKQTPPRRKATVKPDPSATVAEPFETVPDLSNISGSDLADAFDERIEDEK